MAVSSKRRRTITFSLGNDQSHIEYMFDTFKEDRHRQGQKTDERHKFTNNAHCEEKKSTMSLLVVHNSGSVPRARP